MPKVPHSSTEQVFMHDNFEVSNSFASFTEPGEMGIKGECMQESTRASDEESDTDDDMPEGVKSSDEDEEEYGDLADWFHRAGYVDGKFLGGPIRNRSPRDKAHIAKGRIAI